MATAFSDVTPSLPPRSSPSVPPASPRGTQLAQRLASHQLVVWDWDYGTSIHDAVELVVAQPQLSREGTSAYGSRRAMPGVNDCLLVQDAGTGKDCGRGSSSSPPSPSSRERSRGTGVSGRRVRAVVATRVPATPVPPPSPGEDEPPRCAAEPLNSPPCARRWG